MIYSHKEIDSLRHSILLKAVESPDLIIKGDLGELLAVKKRFGYDKYIVVIYKEINSRDGFIVTAYITSNLRWLLKKEVLWSRQL